MSRKVLTLLGLILVLTAATAGAENEKPLSPEEGGWMTLWVLEGDGEISNEEFDKLMAASDEIDEPEPEGVAQVEQSPQGRDEPVLGLVPDMEHGADKIADGPRPSGSPDGLRFLGYLEPGAGVETGEFP